METLSKRDLLGLRQFIFNLILYGNTEKNEGTAILSNIFNAYQMSDSVAQVEHEWES